MFTGTRLTPRDFGRCESLINERRWPASVLYLFCCEVKRTLTFSLIKESLTNVRVNGNILATQDETGGLHERDADFYNNGRRS